MDLYVYLTLYYMFAIPIGMVAFAIGKRRENYSWEEKYLEEPEPIRELVSYGAVEPEEVELPVLDRMRSAVDDRLAAEGADPVLVVMNIQDYYRAVGEIYRFVNWDQIIAKEAAGHKIYLRGIVEVKPSAKVEKGKFIVV
jgi:hypothetical protein